MSGGWSVLVDPGISDASEDTLGLAMDIDPRARTVRLGARVLSGGGPEFWYNAVIRRFFEGALADWTPVCLWLATPAADAILSKIEQGYQGETLWTGDRVASWSPEALHALDALHAEIASILRR